MRFRLSGLRVVSCKFYFFFPLKCLVFFCFQIEDFNWFEVFLLGIDNAEAPALREKKKAVNTFDFWMVMAFSKASNPQSLQILYRTLI